MASGINLSKSLPNRFAVISRALSRRFDSFISLFLPKGLYARALIIIIAPIVLLQSVLVFVFMERHWEFVTKRLSFATAQDISMLIDLYDKSDQSEEDQERLRSMSSKHLGIRMRFLPAGDLPPRMPRPIFALLDKALSKGLRRNISYPFWVDAFGQSRNVEIRVRHPDHTISFLINRSQTHASNSHIFIVWMIGTSLILVTVAVLFMRNQIKPILRLAEAAKQFGMGRAAPNSFEITGATEVREAAHAFVDMRNRIERHVEQRTTMLAGVSHDLRTILTRFKFQLAMLKESPETDAMRSDIREMQHMLEDYLAFTKGDNGETSTLTEIRKLLEDIYTDAEVLEKGITLELPDKHIAIPLRRNAFKRAIFNLITNAARYADNINISASSDFKWLRIIVDDDGPGIPKDKREEVFRPFFRIDSARNQDVGNTGLGLSIARDIIHAHGGDINLFDSPNGGLRATVRIPI